MLNLDALLWRLCRLQVPKEPYHFFPGNDCGEESMIPILEGKVKYGNFG